MADMDVEIKPKVRARAPWSREMVNLLLVLGMGAIAAAVTYFDQSKGLTMLGTLSGALMAKFTAHGGGDK